jgi:hypothetical protein
MPMQFSLLRLFLVIAVFAAAFGLTKWLELGSIFVALPAAIPLSGIVLSSKAHDVMPIIRSLVFCGIGAFVGSLLCPMVRPPYEYGNEFLYMIVGAVIGWLFGLALRAIGGTDSHD